MTARVHVHPAATRDQAAREIERRAAECWWHDACARFLFAAFNGAVPETLHDLQA